MCGICGFLGMENQQALHAMVAAMRHRGPDDNGVVSSGNVSLGMTRLSIQDTSPCGHQPMSNPEKTIWIVYNGEIYNFKEKRRQLEDHGHTFHSVSDTEVILHLYMQYGDECVLQMQGIFAFAIYDAREIARPRLLLARDPLGVKPLLYAQQGEKFIFASEIKSLLSGGLIPPHIDPEALRLLLTFGSIPQPRTFISGVRMLLPGHRLIIQDGTVRDEEYRSLHTDTPAMDIGEDKYQELRSMLRRSLEECVQQQMVSDVPVGAFLSGGIDSSILVAVMAQSCRIPIKTFSVGFEQGSYSADESDEAEKIARFIGTDHTRVLILGDDVAARICHFASSLDQPSVDGLNSYLVSLAASRIVKVAISGTGGDELFAGYPWFIQMGKAEGFRHSHPSGGQITRLIGGFFQNRAFDTLASGPFGRVIDHIRKQGSFWSGFSRSFLIFPARDTSRILSAGILKKVTVGSEYANDLILRDDSSHLTVLQKVSLQTLRGYTQNQLLRDIDAVSMAHSLEVRVPFLDERIVELALSLPDETKLKNPAKISTPYDAYRATGAKRILIDAFKDLLPPDMDLQEKRGFGMPFGTWLKGPLRPVLEDTLSGESVRKRGLFDPDSVQQVKQQFYEDKISWAQIWLLMIIELWCREVLDPLQEPAAA